MEAEIFTGNASVIPGEHGPRTNGALRETPLTPVTQQPGRTLAARRSPSGAGALRTRRRLTFSRHGRPNAARFSHPVQASRYVDQVWRGALLCRPPVSAPRNVERGVRTRADPPRRAWDAACAFRFVVRGSPLFFTRCIFFHLCSRLASRVCTREARSRLLRRRGAFGGVGSSFSCRR